MVNGNAQKHRTNDYRNPKESHGGLNKEKRRARERKENRQDSLHNDRYFVALADILLVRPFVHLIIAWIHPYPSPARLVR